MAPVIETGGLKILSIYGLAPAIFANSFWVQVGGIARTERLPEDHR
jgi:hypothetical protein